MSAHKEIEFEKLIAEHLGAAGWRYAEGDAARYDRARALFPEDTLDWVRETQPDLWEALEKLNGARAGEVLLERLRDRLNADGVVEVLRRGVEILGLRRAVKFAEFKPAMRMNPEIWARYAANRLRVVRQVRFSKNSQESLDLVLFLNGVPVATAELKSDFTQSVNDAVDQYRFDRDPKPKGRDAEPLLSFPGGAAVHFAVSQSAVRMTTRLEGAGTRFLPFDRGDEGAEGNPPNPAGARTAYLWESVWERESFLEILGRYLIARRDRKGVLAAVVFPRYHQLDVTRKLIPAVLASKDSGYAGKYLVQHSAGSGKTNSIAWTAHFLAELHDAEDRKVFDSVLVVSDRTVIDAQLQEALFDFQRQAGVVATVKGAEGSKSAELAGALSGAKKIVVCTIQTFPFALETVRELAATKGKRFAVIADEAHSSQTGEAAKKLKAVLSAEEFAALQDGGEVGVDDLIAADTRARSASAGVTYVAFTATPKAKTLQLFGTIPDPARPAGDDNLPAPFHVYSMRQAIEEKFILDVLKNYTPYALAFKLAHSGAGLEDIEVDKAAAMKGVMRWVRLHPYNIAKKVEIVVEHFRERVSPLLDGTAKAMIVTGSRVEAVRWKLAVEKYLGERGYSRIRTLVAFSGEVTDADSGPDAFTESSPAMNPGLNGRDIRTAFKEEDCRLLLVANKFQTGFDQPLLCGMYVDRRLDGIQAVQTLSRLNRAHPGKDTTFVLDFVNDAEEILKSFKTYHATATLSGVTDPHVLLDLRAKLDAAGHYDDYEIERVVTAEFAGKQADLLRAIEPVADRLLKKHKAAREALFAAQAREDKAVAKSAKEELDALVLFKSDLGNYLRLHTFLSQIFDYANTAVEKRALFFKRLLPLLQFGREREGVDLSGVTLTHHALKTKGPRDLSLAAGDTPKLAPMDESGSGEVQDKQKAYLSELIEKLNALFGAEVSDQDQLVFANHLFGKIIASEELRRQALNNSESRFRESPDLTNAVRDAVIGCLDSHTTLSTRTLNSPEVLDGLLRVLLEQNKLWAALRASAEAPRSESVTGAA